MWVTLNSDGTIIHCAKWKFSPKAVWTNKTICYPTNGQPYFEGETPSSPSDPDPTDNTVETAEFQNDDYSIYVSKYADGWLSAYGEFQNAGQTGGLTISMPSGFAFKDAHYGVTAASSNAEDGGAGDFFKILSRTTTTFTVGTSHLEDELSLEMTDEAYTFMVEGRWK